MRPPAITEYLRSRGATLAEGGEWLVTATLDGTPWGEWRAPTYGMACEQADALEAPTGDSPSDCECTVTFAGTLEKVEG